MKRLFLEPEKILRDRAIIDGTNVRYLTNVLRSSMGDELTLLDGLGKGYKGKIVSIGRDKIDVQIAKAFEINTESPLDITIAQGIPKAEKMEIIIQKATELGVKKVVPLITQRAVVRTKSPVRLERWSKIATSSAQQSGRSKIPLIESITGYKEFLSREFSGVKMIFYEGRVKKGIKEFLRELTVVKEITFLIGSEGGFTEEEVGMAIKKGFTPVGLGPRILRTETAGITALSILQYELGDMGIS
ncbi:MAG: 16S rRNA (uracil(1498)-N(3))-methyltransferase [Nitrospirota bacterium]